MLNPIRNVEVKFVNLTPHPICMLVPKVASGPEEIRVEPSGEVARVKTVEEPVFYNWDRFTDGAGAELEDEETENDEVELNGVPAVARLLIEVTGIPEPKCATIYIVSSMVLEASNRLDIAAPDTGDTAIRDDTGRIVAVRRLIMKQGI